MQERYRSDYSGEFVILETRWAQGKKEQKREWIANPIENHHISGRAACIGSDVDLNRFNYTILQRHRGGLLGSKKLQTYGVGKIAQSMRLDFTVETNSSNLKQLVDTNYSENNIVYTTPRNCITYPGQFYLIPYTPRLPDLALSLYLAAFDEHKEIFLLGYNIETPAPTNTWYEQVKSVFDTYSGVKFYLIGEKTNMFNSWLDCSNVNHMNYREWISYCDV